MRTLITVFMTLFVLHAVAIPALAQQTAEPPEAAASEETTTDAEATEEDSDAEDEFDDSDLDLQSYDEDDDDFVPTEEIPADEAIPFPSDI